MQGSSQSSDRKRRCIVCHAPLSRYNQSDACSCHKREDVLKARQQLRHAAAEAALLSPPSQAPSEPPPLPSETQIQAEPTETDPQETVADPDSDELTALRDALSSSWVTPAQVLEAICAFYRVDLESMRMKNQCARAVAIRRTAVYLLREDARCSFTDIGDLLGQHHTTVIYAYERAKESVDDPAIVQRMKEVRERYPRKAHYRALSSAQPSTLPVERRARAIAVVAHLFGIQPRDMFDSRRPRIIHVPRQVASYILRECSGFSLPQIGALFNQHHTTVLHSWRKVDLAVKQGHPISAIVKAAVESFKTKTMAV